MPATVAGNRQLDLTSVPNGVIINGVREFWQTSRPTANASGDRWYNPTTRLQAQWDGVDWVSMLFTASLDRISSASANSNAINQTSIPFAANQVIKIRDWVVGYTNPNTTPTANYHESYLTRRTVLAGNAGTDIGSPALTNSASGIAVVSLNTTLTLNTDVITFGVRTSVVGTVASVITIQPSFTYQLVL